MYIFYYEILFDLGNYVLTTAKMFTEIGKSGEATARREASLKKMEFERKKSFFEDRGLQRTQKSDCQPSYDDLDEEFPEEVLEGCLRMSGSDGAGFLS